MKFLSTSRLIFRIYSLSSTSSSPHIRTQQRENFEWRQSAVDSPVPCRFVIKFLIFQESEWNICGNEMDCDGDEVTEEKSSWQKDKSDVYPDQTITNYIWLPSSLRSVFRSRKFNLTFSSACRSFYSATYRMPDRMANFSPLFSVFPVTNFHRKTFADQNHQLFFCSQISNLWWVWPDNTLDHKQNRKTLEFNILSLLCVSWTVKCAAHCKIFMQHLSIITSIIL